MTPDSFKIFFVFTILKIIFCQDTPSTLSPTLVYNNTTSKSESVTSFNSTYSESTARYYPTDPAPKSSSLSHYTRDSKPHISPILHHLTDFERRLTLAHSTNSTRYSSSASVYYRSSVPNFNNSTDLKNPSLTVCPRITLKHGDYIIFSNGTLYVEILDLTLNNSYYIQEGDSVVFCEIGFVDEKTELYWNAAHYLLSAFVILAFTISISPTYIRIISSKNLVLTLTVLLLFNFAFQMVRKSNLQKLYLWFLLPYVLYFVCVIIAAWITLVVFDFIILAIKIFGFRIYSNKVIIERANWAICLLLLILALVTTVTSFYDITSIYLSYSGYLDKAIACLDKSLPAFTPVLILTFCGVIGCIFREVAFEKYADDFNIDFSKSNIVFLRKYFAVVSVGIFIAGAMIYKNWLAFFISVMLSCIVVTFGYGDSDFAEEKLSFFNYIPIAGVSRPIEKYIHV